MHDNVLRLFPEAEAAPKGDFEAVWKLWPNKANKAMARAKYEAALKGTFRTKAFDKDSGGYVDLELSTTPEAILAGVKAYVSSQLDRNTYRLKDDGKFIPHLATWINRGRWEDFE
jgi:hypothetical protein